MAFEKAVWGMDVYILNEINSIINIFSLKEYEQMSSKYYIGSFPIKFKKFLIKPHRQFYDQFNMYNVSKQPKYTGCKMCTPNQISPLGLKYLSKKNWRIIFIYRDGRDSILSMMRRETNQSIGFASYRWNTAINLMKELQSKENVITVPFETLLYKEKKVLRKICDFLQVVFQDDMLHGYINIKIEAYKKNSFDKSKAFSYKREKDKEIISNIEKRIKCNLSYCNSLRDDFTENL